MRCLCIAALILRFEPRIGRCKHCTAASNWRMHCQGRITKVLSLVPVLRDWHCLISNQWTGIVLTLDSCEKLTARVEANRWDRGCDRVTALYIILESLHGSL